jgi:hypothetical protein
MDTTTVPTDEDIKTLFALMREKVDALSDFYTAHPRLTLVLRREADVLREAAEGVRADLAAAKEAQVAHINKRYADRRCFY